MFTTNVPDKILIVDDDPLQRILLQEALSEYDYNIKQAADGEEALIVFDEFMPDLVLLDVQMPKTDGFTVCKRIRKNYPDKIVSIVLVTGLEDFTSIQTAYRSGATDFITKPLNFVLIKHRVKYLIRSLYTQIQCQDSEKQLSMMLATIPDDIFSFNKEGEITFSNIKQLRSICFPVNNSSVTIQHLNDLFTDEVTSIFIEKSKKIDKINKINVFIFSFISNNMNYTFEARLSIQDDNNFLAILQDKSEEDRVQNQLEHLTNYDFLTGMPNRTMLFEKLEKLILKSKETNHQVAVMVIDVNKFKTVNESYGHSVGDKLLQNIANRIKKTCLNYSNVVHYEVSGTHCISRICGDDFAIIVSNDDVKSLIDSLSQKLIEAFRLPFSIHEIPIYLAVSIGISICPNDSANATELFQNVSVAMSSAKQAGLNKVKYYTKDMNITHVKKMQLENQLRKAIKNKELQVYYQPQIDITTGHVIGAEALIRWYLDGKYISPMDFIPLAEEIGVIDQIGEFVLQQSCEFLKVIQAQNPEFRKMSVNVSVQQFMQASFINCISQCIQKYQILPQSIDLEITENILMENTTNAIAVLKKLKHLGVLLSIDDFGTGYSSFNYLKQFPVDTLKIDQSFVRDIAIKHSDARIVRTIINLAQTLGLNIIAEGVETEDQLNLLKKYDCTEVQGFYFNKALPPKDFLEYIDFKESDIRKMSP